MVGARRTRGTRGTRGGPGGPLPEPIVTRHRASSGWQENRWAPLGALLRCCHAAGYSVGLRAAPGPSSDRLPRLPSYAAFTATFPIPYSKTKKRPRK